MAVRLGGGDDEVGEIAEINVTPFIDVALVLLIIFMVAAPLSTVAVPVDLPGSNAPAAAPPERPVYLSVKRDGTLWLGEDGVAPDALGGRLDAATGGDRSRRVSVRADAGLPYGALMGAMNSLRAAGYTHLALVGLENPDARNGAAAP